MNTAFLRDIVKLNDLAQLVVRLLVNQGGQSSNPGRRKRGSLSFSSSSFFFFVSLRTFFFLFFLLFFSSFFFLSLFSSFFLFFLFRFSFSFSFFFFFFLSPNQRAVERTLCSDQSAHAGGWMRVRHVARPPPAYACGRGAVGGAEPWPQVHPGVVRGARAAAGL